MRRDVAPAAGPRVAMQPVQEPAQRGGDPGAATLHVVQHIAIPRKDAHDRGQVVRCPEALHKGFRCADRPAVHDGCIELRISNVDPGLQALVCIGAAENRALPVLGNHQPAAGHRTQASQEEPPRQAIEKSAAFLLT